MPNHSPKPNHRAAVGVPTTSTGLSQAILAKAQAGRTVIQDFVPLADSLEWQLGQEYLRLRGNQAFLGDAFPVPHVINNDGTLSRNAAEVFFASVLAAEQTGELEEDLYVLELGIGVGLFARFFLDHFKALCQEHKKDFYDRLCYIAGDRSEKMLLDAARHGVFANHPGRYRLRMVDALDPAKLLEDVALHGRSTPLRAVFLNYLLDCLPAAVLELDGDKVTQLCVRTCVARNVRLEDVTDLTAEMLTELARTPTPQARQTLLEVYGHFASEYDYRPVDVHALPHGDFALDFGRPRTKRLLHSHGAIQSLERLLELVHPQGFILLNDYGPTQLTTTADEFEHQRFSLATFVGVNFPELKAFFGDSGKYRWLKPNEESGSIHPRLVGRQPSSETVLRFHELFGKAAETRRQEPQAKARACIQAGRFEMAADLYRQALDRQPGNWVLLNEVAMFLIFSLRDVKAGIDLAKVAVGLNPACSAELWNTLGDGLFEYGRLAEARSAYQRALRISPQDIRARYNLVWVHAREKDFAAALGMVAEGLLLDQRGEYRERFLQKQNEVLALLARQQQQDYLKLVNLVSRYAGPEAPGAARADGSAPPAPETTRPANGSIPDLETPGGDPHGA